MARIPPGVQLGRRPPPGVRFLFDAALAVLAFAVVTGAVSLLRLRGEGAAEAPAPGGAAPALAPAAHDAEALREAAVLMRSGAVGGVRLAEVFTTVRGAAPPGVRVTGVTIRPEPAAGGSAVAEASLSARASDAEAVAGLLGALLRSDAVLAAEVISERRQRDGSVVVEITSRISTEPPAVPGPEEPAEGREKSGGAR